METIASLEGFYSHLDSLSFEATDRMNLRKELKNLEDEDGDKQTQERISWEIYVCLFDIIEGRVEPFSQTTNKDGSINSYPSYGLFTDSTYDYLIMRAKTTANFILKAKYWHILWGGSKKHSVYSKNAIDAYISIITKENTSEEEQWIKLKAIKNVIPIAGQSNYRIDELYALTEDILSKPDYLDVYKNSLIGFLINIPKARKEKFESYQNILLELAKKYKVELKESSILEDMMETGLRIAEKRNLDVKKWNELVGDTILRQVNKRKNDETGIAKSMILARALQFYKQSGNNRKINKVIKLYNENKKNVNLAETYLPLEGEQVSLIQEYTNARVASLIELGSEAIFYFLTTDTTLTPSIDDRIDNTWTTFDYVSLLRFDINVNIGPKGKRNTKKEKRFMDYYFRMQYFVAPFLGELFSKGIRKGTLSAEAIIGHFIDNSWFGKTLAKETSSKKFIEYNWISVIAPALVDFFRQMESGLYDPSSKPNFVLCIDSLTLKFEGVLRDFATMLKIPPNKQAKNGEIRQKYIEELLQEKKIKDYFSESDLLYFEFVFVSKDGLNLRNNVAHGFFHFSNYHFFYMHLLICAFLKIGKYNIKN